MYTYLSFTNIDTPRFGMAAVKFNNTDDFLADAKTTENIEQALRTKEGDDTQVDTFHREDHTYLLTGSERDEAAEQDIPTGLNADEQNPERRENDSALEKIYGASNDAYTWDGNQLVPRT